jgi:DMSO/TMAO reductase YedYZ molybdopterin-dependent catalytic subunit
LEWSPMSMSRHLSACAVAVSLVLVGAGCSRIVPPSATPIPPAAAEQSAVPTSTDLGTVEVSSYKGKPLDTVASEPENSIKGPQQIDRSTYRLAVTGKVDKPLKLTYEQVRAMPSFRKVTTLNCVEGWSKTYLWQGVRLSDLLTEAGYDPAAKTVIFTSYDGYSTSLPLDFVVSRNLLLAYAMNDKVIPPERGFPFQVVAEDRFGYKWAKWVTGIEVSDNADYRGYWEQRGYDNDALLPGAK